MRAGEVDGTDYHFLTPRRIPAAARRQATSSSTASYGGELYGTLKAEIDRHLRRRQARGARHRDRRAPGRSGRSFPESCTCSCCRPRRMCWFSRLTDRETEEPVACFGNGCSRAAEELTAVGEYDYVVVNDDLVCRSGAGGGHSGSASPPGQPSDRACRSWSSICAAMCCRRRIRFSRSRAGRRRSRQALPCPQTALRSNMRIITPQEVAKQAGNKYLGVLVAAKFARYLNEFPKDQLAEQRREAHHPGARALVDGRPELQAAPPPPLRGLSRVGRPARRPRRVGRDRLLQELHPRPPADRGRRPGRCGAHPGGRGVRAAGSPSRRSPGARS